MIQSRIKRPIAQWYFGLNVTGCAVIPEPPERRRPESENANFLKEFKDLC